MRPELIQYCKCLGCDNNSLFIKEHREEDQEHILEGTLQCKQCSQEVPIHKGIPLFFGELSEEVESNVKNFGDQWQTYNKLLEENQIEFNSYYEGSGFSPSQMAGKLVLDAGCGSGKFAYLSAQYPNTTIIGMDLSHSTLAAFESTKHLPNVHIIQADILNPPFADETFDFIYSIGVLHHTENPPLSFTTLMKKLKPNSQFFFWLYSKEGNELYLSIVDPFRKYFFCHLPHWVNNVIACILAFMTWPVLLLYGLIDAVIPNKTILKKTLPMFEYLLYFRRVGPWLWRNTVLDKMIPHIAHHYSKTELKNWLADNQVTERAITYRNGNSWGVLCEKPNTPVAV